MTIDSERAAQLGDDTQRDTAKWQRHHGSVAGLWSGSHGSAIAGKHHTETTAECEAPYTRSGDSWHHGKKWQNTWFETEKERETDRDRGDDVARKHSDEAENWGMKWKITFMKGP